MKKVPFDINISRIDEFISKHLKRVSILEGGVPPFSSVEFSINGMCSRRCIFCPRVNKNFFPNINKHLSLRIFKKVMQELKHHNYNGRISFSGFCEPLMTKNLEEYILTGKKICPNLTIEISTNGDFLTERRLESLFKAGLDNIRVSLYDDFSQEEKFLGMQKRFSLNEQQFIMRKRYLTEPNYGLTICNRGGSVTLKNEMVKLEPLKNPLKQPCYYPFYKIMVDYTGDALICSNDWMKRLIVGNLERQTIFYIWNSRKLNEVRIKLIKNNRKFAPCDVCDVNGLYNGQNHFDAWVNFYNNIK